MSDVRDELISIIGKPQQGFWKQYQRRVADAILERFEVTPKPVISDEELGRITVAAWSTGGAKFPSMGQRLRELLDEAGLEIVRKDATE